MFALCVRLKLDWYESGNNCDNADWFCSGDLCYSSDLYQTVVRVVID